jgi:predicted PurR-regulated permease PerM
MKDPFKSFNAGRANFFLVAVITCILAGAVLKITAPVLLPFVIAVLLALVAHPLTVIPQKFHIPRIVSILLAVLLIIAGLFFIGVVLSSSTRSLLTLYPRYENRLTEIYIWLGKYFELPYNEGQTFFQNIWSQLGIRTRIQYFALTLSNTFLGFLRDAVLVVVFMIFLLLEAAVFGEKVDTAFSGKHSGQIKKIIADIMREISRYLSIKFIISLVTGTIVAAALWVIGLEFAVLWGIVQFILNFIPNLGSIAVGLAVSIFGLLQFWPDPVPVVAVALVMLTVNMVIGYGMEPKIMGDNLGLSPIVVLLSLVIWGWLWGFAGMILAVPMTMIIKIICENVPVLEPISILLGSRKAVTAKKLEYTEKTAEDGQQPPDDQE